MIKKIIISILSLLILSCDSSDSLNISVLLEECTSSIDNIEYESSLYNCGDLEFLRARTKDTPYNNSKINGYYYQYLEDGTTLSIERYVDGIFSPALFDEYVDI